MATDFIMPRLPDQQQPAFYPPPQQHEPRVAAPVYPQPNNYSSQQISPVSTSASVSPASPPKTYMTRQVRPLYMPAVLRPTEFPSKAPPPKVKSPVDEEGIADEDKILKSNSSFISLSGLSALGRLSRRSTGDSAKSPDGTWNLDIFPNPTGSPTREHWKPDSASPICDHATCRRTFSYFTRRHHCRKCGNIFCDAHSTYEIPLDQNAVFNPRSPPSRACAHCYAQFKQWRTRANSLSTTDSSASTLDNTNYKMAGARADTIMSAQMGSPVAISSSSSPTAVPGKIPPTPVEVAASVPRDWTWSTF